MKRDMDLVRAILMKLEEHPDGFAPPVLTIDGYTEEQIGHHVYLMGQAGLVTAADASTRGNLSPVAEAVALAWAGHEFLADARDESRWQQAKSLVKEKGGTVSLGVLAQLLAALARRAFGLP